MIESDNKDPRQDGRLYKVVRRITPEILGVRTCSNPSCKQEKPLDRFRKVRRGKNRWGWLCDTCRAARKKALKVNPHVCK